MHDDDAELDDLVGQLSPRKADVYVHGAAFYVALLKSGYSDEAMEFAEWYLETFDIDLED